MRVPQSAGAAVASSATMHRLRRAAMVAVLVAIGVAAVVALAWAVDMRAHRGRVARNVVLAGREVGGMHPNELITTVQTVVDDYERAEVKVEAPRGGFTVPGGTLGLAVGPGATAESVLKIGRTGAVPGRVWRWATSLLSHRDAPIEYSVDADAVWAVVAEHDKGPRTPPQEPGIEFAEGTFRARAGKAGRGIDPDDVRAALPDALAEGRPIVVRVDRGTIPPRHSLADARDLARRASAMPFAALPVKAGPAAAALTPATLKPLLRADAAGENLAFALDAKETLAALGRALPKAGTPVEETRFTVSGGEVKIIEGKSGTACCADEAVAMVQRAVLAGTGSAPAAALELPLRRVDPLLTLAQAQALGVKEPVASFTTNHPAGQPRVRNIHHIANLLRGVLLQPGQRFSVNSFVGRRTVAKGFVVAPVIEDGKFTDSVGGGISQFATTLFNAAFFAGLDIPEYQSHSIYISRYPYGREATLSFPKPDLVLVNSTPHGILIWPTYTGSSITVTIYSTKNVEAAQTSQTRTPKGPCTRVVTQRTRTYADGRSSKTDRFVALYRPGEGVNC